MDDSYLAFSECNHLFNALKGHALQRVRRFLFRDDYARFSPSVREEESDGSVELAFSNGQVIHFVPHPESMSVRISAGPMPQWGESYMALDVSRNAFWSLRVGKRFAHALGFVSHHAQREAMLEFGVELRLEGSSSVWLEYVDTDEQPDTLRVGLPVVQASCRVVALCA